MEMLVTLSIAAILAAVAVPSFSTWLIRSRVDSQAGSLLSGMRLARSEAASRGAWVVLCPTADHGASCSTSAANWSRGWMVFVDVDRSGSRQAGSEALLQLADGISGNLSATVTGFTDAVITFSPYGGLLQGGAPAAGGSIRLCAASGTSGRSVRVDASGRPSSMKVTCP
jgi:type IV fimbrial biogenesis protein FimT